MPISQFYFGSRLAEELGDKDFVDWGNQGDPVSASFATDDHGSNTNDMKTNPRKRAFIAGSISCFPIRAQGYSVALQIDPEWSGHHKCRRDDIVQFQK